jgi:hypothetical protein
MRFSLTPPRHGGAEHLDDPALGDATMLRSLTDISRSNCLFGGKRAALRALASIFPTLPRDATLLDVGTGLGDIPHAAQRAALRYGVRLSTIGLDSAAPLTVARHVTSYAVCADALRLPLMDRSVDVAMCSQVLHHFQGDAAATVVRELNRVARHAVIVCDLRRSWIAAAGFWLASFPLRFHPVTRHDGVVSVLRAYTVTELQETVDHAIGVRPAVERDLGFRITASWRPV